MVYHQVAFHMIAQCSFRPFVALSKPSQDVCPSKSLNERLWHSFTAVRSPVLAKTTYSAAVNDFVSVAVLGYECGLTDLGFQNFLTTEVAELDANNCLELVCLVWITLMYSYKSIPRWASTDPVSDTMFSKWKGFVNFIVIAYFEKGMAWVPIDRLQLEQRIMMGYSESPSNISEKARIVFTTLEKVAPQFPSI